ncbi:MAG: CotH kinase family protein, partial [Acholeplasmataceae bacterium]|nr:CotH kinase family protein [Acholeplasmataceae bacterium]
MVKIFSKLIKALSLSFLALMLFSCGKKEFKLSYLVDGEVYQEIHLKEGETITEIAPPTKEGHSFSGWDNLYSKMPQRDVIVTGHFLVNYYEISFYDDDGTLLERLTVEYNEVPVPQEPSKSDQGYLSFEFERWDKEIEAATEDTNYKAVYQEITKRHQITYLLNGEVFYQSYLIVGEEIQLIADPEEEGHLFSGWENSYLLMPDHDITISGSLEKEVFEITFYDEDGVTILETLEVEYQELPTPKTPTKSNYLFYKWDKPLLPATENTSYQAKYREVGKSYQITYHLEKGSNDKNNVSSYQDDDNFVFSAPFKLGYDFLGWFIVENGENKEITSTEGYYEDLELYAHWEIEYLELPIVKIDLKDHELGAINRDDYVDATFSLLNLDEEFILEDLLLNFRGRGHGSWVNYDKKGYKLKLDKKQALFGLPKSKHWALVANGHDDSMMRHNIAYQLVNDNLTNIDYTTSVHIVELYINGEYRGVYSLFEHKRAEKGRVEIDSEFGVLDSGFFLEYDAYAPEEGIEGIDYFRVKGLKYPFEMKTPKPDDYAEEGLTEAEFRAQVAYIKNYLQEVVDSILTKNYQLFTTLVDEDSFVDMYLIHEFMKNTDTGWSSLHFAKDKGGKLKATAAWDFDLSSGITRGDSSTAGLYVADGVLKHSPSTANELFIALMKQEEFVNKVKARYLEVHEGFLNTIETMFLEIEDYQSSYDRDAEKWTKGVKVYLNEQENLLNWLTNRAAWFLNWAR